MSEKKLRIAIILPSIITKNGTAKQSLELARILRKFGNHVTFYTFAYHKNSSFPEFKDFELKYCINVEKSFISIFIKNGALLETIFLYVALLMVPWFRSLFKRDKIDIYNPHDWFGIWAIGKTSNNSKIIANINDVPNRDRRDFVTKVKLFIDRKKAINIDQILVLDEINRNKVIKWLGIGKEKISIVRSGIDLKKYKNFKQTTDLKKIFNLSKNDFIFSCANLLALNRRYEDVIEALYILRKEYELIFHVVILSRLDFDSDYADYLMKLVKKRRLDDQVHFIDKFFTDYERMMYIKSSDALIFPNSPQTWGLTVLEAMALGVPVIVSDGSGVSEVLHNGKDSIIYKSRNVDELVQKMMFVVNSPKKMALIKKTAKEYVLNSFTWEKFGKKVEKIMHDKAYRY